ncbi:CDC50/LEM3 family [Tribonema minus]|uniref:CDC50/LEM3 family n=1 Tax=Tribonema minus TaxID=303371 RepID=A0A836CGC5_9STRA|nr:CDC50/LEM3 family [Tribonema minus]
MSNSGAADGDQKSRRPAASPFNQQQLASFSPIFTPRTITGIYLTVAVFFILLGSGLYAVNGNAQDYEFQYDGNGADSTDCEITTANEGKNCTISFTLTKDLPAPIYVYYELHNFYSNHRKYVQSFSQDQLLGSQISDLSACTPLERNGDLTLSPCGLIANTLFNDIITVTSDQVMEETGIAWNTDLDKFEQPHGFVTTACAATDECASCLQAAYNSDDDYDGCGIATDASGTSYAYWYPDEDKIQYLYETFPDVISPLEGVKNEHFMVWMRVAGLRQFRKPYGKISQSLAKGTTVTFNVVNNFLVSSFGGSKSLVMSHVSDLGAPNVYWPQSFLVIGFLVLGLALVVILVQTCAPRPLGDVKMLFDS